MRLYSRMLIYLLFYCVILCVFLFSKKWIFKENLRVPAAFSNSSSHGEKIMLKNQNTQRPEELNSTLTHFYDVSNAQAGANRYMYLEDTATKKGYYNIYCKCNADCNNTHARNCDADCDNMHARNCTADCNTTHARKQMSTGTRDTACKRYKHDHRRFIRGPDHIGRLGNWLFQFAATLGLAESLTYRPAIKSSNPILKYFNIRPQYVSDIALTNVLRIDEEKWKNNTWMTRTMLIAHNLTMHGFFQSWTYFNNIADCIRETLAIKLSYLNKAKEFIQHKIPPSKTLVGVHVRRGDMLSEGSKQFGRLAASKFYIWKAIAFYRKRCENSHFIVCSDDMKWSRENIYGSDVTFSTFKEPVVDLAILSLCDHVIITVGTFGWWGGWLAGGSVVYLSDYPRKGSKLDKWQPKDEYYPPNWIGMNNSA